MRKGFLIDMDTDILGGIQIGYKTILTLSGVTKSDDLIKFAFKPDMVIDSVADLKITEALK